MLVAFLGKMLTGARSTSRGNKRSETKGRARGSSCDEQVAPFQPPMSDADEDEHLFYVLCEQVKAIADHSAQSLDARDLEEDDMAECPTLCKLGCAALVELLRARAPVLAREVRHATRHAKRKLPSTADVAFVARNHRNTARSLAAFER